MKSCMECELQSGYKKDGGISDMQALLCKFISSLFPALIFCCADDLTTTADRRLLRQHQIHGEPLHI